MEKNDSSIEEKNLFPYLRAVEEFESKPVRDINDINIAAEIIISNLEKALVNSLKGLKEKEVYLLLSGGIDSSFLYFILKKKNLNIKSCCFGTDKSKDLNFVKQNFRDDNIEFIVVEKKQLDKFEKEFLKEFDYKKRLDINLGLPLYIIGNDLAKKNCRYLIVGSGTEELFFGYHYQQKLLEKEKKSLEEVNKFQVNELKNLVTKDLLRNNKILEKFNIKPILPYLDYEFVKNVLKINPYLNSHELKKFVLRKAALTYGISEKIALRKKIAFQYGSGITK
ncbi:MAG: asparagine synthase-related protein [Candidatus Anstonellales archaeon]